MDVYTELRIPGRTFFNVTDHVTSQSATDFRGSMVNGTSSQVYVPSEAERVRIIVIAALLALTVIGNVILIAALLWKRSRRIKRVNILLMNLAFGDIGVALFVNSTEILFLAFGNWALGPVICKLSVYIQMVCLSSATNLLTAMSIDRYQVIVKPMQSLARRPRICLKIVIAWVLSLIFAIPQLFIFVEYIKGFQPDNAPIRVCGSKGYTAAWQRKVNFTFTTVYILIVPMVIMLYCYAKIIQVVWIRAKPQTGRPAVSPRLKSNFNSSCRSSTLANSYSVTDCHSSSNNEKSGFSCGCDEAEASKISSKATKSVTWVGSVKKYKDSNTEPSVPRVRVKTEDELSSGSPRMSVRRNLVTASKRRVLLMTLTVVVSFLVCQTPYIMVSLVRIYSDYHLQLEKVVFITEVLVMVHSTLNPILYGLFTLRQYHLKRIISFMSFSTSSSHHATPQQPLSKQHIGESNKLLKNSRTKLNSSGTTTTSVTTAFIKMNKNINPSLYNHTNSQEIIQTSHKDYPAASSSSNVSKPNPKPQLYFTRFRKRKSHRSEATLFTNMEAIHLANQRQTKSLVTDQLDTKPNTFPPCTLFANSHTVNPYLSINN